MDTKTVQKLKKAMNEGLFKPETASLFLKGKGLPITSAQLRYWAKKGYVPSRQAMKGSPVYFSFDTLKSIIEGELPNNDAV